MFLSLSDSAIAPSDSAAVSSAPESTENGGGFIRTTAESSLKSADAFPPISRAASPSSDVFSAPAVQVSSVLFFFFAQMLLTLRLMSLRYILVLAYLPLFL